MRPDPSLHRRADLYQGWDDDRSTEISRAKFMTLMQGVVIGFFAGAAFAGLVATAFAVSS